MGFQQVEWQRAFQVVTSLDSVASVSLHTDTRLAVVNICAKGVLLCIMEKNGGDVWVPI